MEIKEALEIIEEEMPFTSGVIEEAMDTIRDVVAKRTPKMVVTKQRFLLDKFCPNCDENLTNFGCYSLNSWKYRYCAYCGQRLDWSDNLER
jgi:hypothetical protein